MPWPNRELASARPFRRSPVYHLLKQANACFGTKMGWERPNFFAPPGQGRGIEYGWGQQNWLPWSDAEQRATREGVALFDQTSLLQVPGAPAGTPSRCCSGCAPPMSRSRPGRTVYTGMLNERGTYEADVTVTRLSARRVPLVSSAASTERDQDRITSADARGRCTRHCRRHLVPTPSTASWGRGRATCCSRLSRTDFSDEAFPFGTSREIDLGYATVRATRITYVGELGWELYVPAEFAVGVYEDLMTRGRDLGLANAGYYAIDSLRLEKGYRAFGRELTPDYNPVEAGLLFACKLKTGIPLPRPGGGRAGAGGRTPAPPGLARPGRRRPGPPMIWGGELVLRDGAAVGQVTSGAWGETLGGCVGLAYIRLPDDRVLTPDLLRAGAYQVNVGGQLYPATVHLRPPFDPAGDRIRGRYQGRGA